LFPLTLTLSRKGRGDCRGSPTKRGDIVASRKGRGDIVASRKEERGLSWLSHEERGYCCVLRRERGQRGPAASCGESSGLTHRHGFDIVDQENQEHISLCSGEMSYGL